MAGPAPKTRNWTARENAHKPSGLHLIVAGLVQVTNTNQRPVLTESAERNPKHLGLTLTMEETGEPGLAVICWKPAPFHKEVTANQFDSVTIRWGSTSIAEVPVVDDSEHAKHATAMMAAVNAKHGTPAKKAAPKAAAAKPAAPKPAAAAPKAAAKKAAPKKAKKVAKKAKKAKKAAPKKAVAARVVRAVGGWAKGAKKALRSVMGTPKKKKAAKKAAKKAKGKKKKR